MPHPRKVRERESQAGDLVVRMTEDWWAKSVRCMGGTFSNKTEKVLQANWDG